MKNKANIWIGGGLLLLVAALCLAVYNVWDGYRAANSAEDLVRQIEDQMPQSETFTPVQAKTEQETEPKSEREPEQYPADGSTDDLSLPTEMPVMEIEGNEYIGTVELPALGLSLPVMSEWSDSKLKLSPCRFSGSVYLDDMIIAAHNYPKHFGGLKKLNVNDEVIFTNAEGCVFTYTVLESQRLGSTELDELNAGEWDLTLFTCTVGGESRVVVRCERIENSVDR